MSIMTKIAIICHTGSRGDKYGYYERVFTGPDERMG